MRAQNCDERRYLDTYRTVTYLRYGTYPFFVSFAAINTCKMILSAVRTHSTIYKWDKAIGMNVVFISPRGAAFFSFFYVAAG